LKLQKEKKLFCTERYYESKNRCRAKQNKDI